MKLAFIDRAEELARLAGLLARREGSLGVLYGRRSCGKSRLIREVLSAGQAVYYVGDQRESGIQRASLAGEVARVLPGFAGVTYPDWDSLLVRWWDSARPGMFLVVDEFPALVSVAPELPS